MHKCNTTDSHCPISRNGFKVVLIGDRPIAAIGPPVHAAELPGLSTRRPLRVGVSSPGRRQPVGPLDHSRYATTAAVPATRPGAHRTRAWRPSLPSATNATGHSATAPAHRAHHDHSRPHQPASSPLRIINRTSPNPMRAGRRRYAASSTMPTEIAPRTAHASRTGSPIQIAAAASNVATRVPAPHTARRGMTARAQVP